MGTLTFRATEVDRIRKGDRITAIDGRDVAFTVVKPYGPLPGSEVMAIGVTMPNGRDVNIYPDQNIAESVTIERADRKPATRTIDGVRFIKTGDKYWETEDGKYVVAYEEAGVTTCEFPHPMRDGYCPGQENHFYYQWLAGLKNDDKPTPEFADTFREAAQWVADKIHGKIK